MILIFCFVQAMFSDLISDENSYFLVLCNIQATGIKNRNVEAGMIQILWCLMNFNVDI